jgi:crossover junction endodeoxyribonuclease RuvC
VRILGIDPGLQRTGYACVERLPKGGVRLLDAGIFRLSARASIANRLLELDTDLSALIDEWRPERMAVESVFSHPKHLRTAIIMAHARGVVLLAAERAGISIREFPPASVKRALTGNGAATKRQMQLAVATRCGLSEPPSPSDVADAIAIALADVQRSLLMR